jgi:hypothetical protein
MYQTKPKIQNNESVGGNIKFTNADYYYQTLTQFYLDFVDRMDLNNLNGAILRFRFIYVYAKPFIIKEMTEDDKQILTDFEEIHQLMSEMPRQDFNESIKKISEITFRIQDLMFVKIEVLIQYMAKAQMLLPISYTMPDLPSGLFTGEE